MGISTSSHGGAHLDGHSHWPLASVELTLRPMASMTVARMRVVLREMGNSFIGDFRHITCVVVRMVPNSLNSGQPQIFENVRNSFVLSRISIT